MARRALSGLHNHGAVFERDRHIVPLRTHGHNPCTDADDTPFIHFDCRSIHQPQDRMAPSAGSQGFALA